MPVPQTLTSGALGFSTKWSASSMHTFKFPWPAPSPRTAWPSMYAFWLMSNFAFFTKTPEEVEMREASKIVTEIILDKILKYALTNV